MITFDNMTPVVSTCPICGGDVPEDGVRICAGVKVIECSHLQQPIPTFYGPHFPVAKDDEILAVLKEIRSVLEVMKETLRLIRHKN